MVEAPPARTARDLVELVLDEGSFEPWHKDVVSDDPLGFAGYRARLAEAEERVGLRESVLTGAGTIGGRPLAVVAGEFGFLGGSVGVATGERVARAFERAEEWRVPVLAMPASGGMRMQEGTLAFLQMVKAVEAVRQFRRAGLLYVVYLTHPTTGGVLASWGLLGAVTFAEPGALLGFSGPRMTEVLTGSRLPEGVQRSESFLAHGLVDDVVAPAELKGRVARLLEGTSPAPAAGAEPPDLEEADETDAWESVVRSREPGRPGAREVLGACGADMTFLGGGTGGERRCLVGLGRMAAVPAVVVAQNRRAEGGARIGPADLRLARRGMGVASQVGLPLVTMIDTPGTDLSAEAEEDGLAAEIAQATLAMLEVTSPTVAVLLGEGASGGALALFPADRVVAAEHAWLSPIAPEGASAILYRSADRAPELAVAQRIGARQLRGQGIVDVVVPERDGFMSRLGAVVGDELRALVAQNREERLRARSRRYRGIGTSDGGSG